MTTYTSNIRIPHLDQNVAQPEIPENVAKDILDNILSNVYVLDVTVADTDITIEHQDNPKYVTNWQSFMIEITDTLSLLTVGVNVILPDNPRPYIFKNSTAESLNFKTSGTGISLSAGSNAYCFSDGTNMEKLEFAATGAGTLLETLNDTPSGYGTADNILVSNGSDTFTYYDLNLKLNADGGTISNYGETSNILGSVSGATTIDLANGNVVTVTISGATTFTFSTTHTNTSFTLLLTDASTNITWPTVSWEGGIEPTWSATGDDLVTFAKIGSVWVGSALIGVS